MPLTPYTEPRERVHTESDRVCEAAAEAAATTAGSGAGRKPMSVSSFRSWGQHWLSAGGRVLQKGAWKRSAPGSCSTWEYRL